jgi:acyl carrier protein
MSTVTTISVDEALLMLAEIFEEPPENITAETRREDVEGWDSLGELSIMAEFDERFGITLDTEALDNFKRVSDLLQALKDNQALSGS